MTDKQRKLTEVLLDDLKDSYECGDGFWTVLVVWAGVFIVFLIEIAKGILGG